MGILEEGSRQRTQRNELRKIILQTVQAAGIIGLALVAPNVIGGMEKLGLIPSRRQRYVVRRSCARLIKAGMLKRNEKGQLRLTKKGESALRRLEMHDYAAPKPARWDHKWRVLIFDVPEYRKGLRDKIRRTLEVIGFTRLQDSVWIYPYDCEDLMTLLKADFHIGKDLLYMVVDTLENDSALKSRFGLK